MPKHQGMANLVAKAILSESKGKRISLKFMKHDPEARGCIPVLKAVSIICDILRIPAPLGPDKPSVESRKQILHHVNFKIESDPENPGEEVVEYGHFLKAFRQSLRTTPLIATNPYVKSDAERNMKKMTVKKTNMTFDEISKAIDLNLPKYYRSTTDAFLKMKPPGGKLKVGDFARFMRSINLDLDDDMLNKMFRKYDKNHNGAIDAWEFFECFGGAISGHKDDSSTSLFMDKVRAPKQAREMKVKDLTPKEVCELIKERLPFHFRSSTKAFLAAKGGGDPGSHTIKFKDLKVFLQNMNIVVSDETIQGLFAFLDEDGSGGIHAKEFITTFGHAISGEKSENINDSDHLSYHNTRPDNRVPIVPPKHQWTYEEVKTTLGERLGMIHTSSTIAFMKAKKSNARFMTVVDLKRILKNLNIEPPEHITQRIYNEMDEDGDGEIECSEFLTYFGSYINGFSGSFETKPDWYYKEISDLSAHIDKIDGVHVNHVPETLDEKQEIGQDEKLKRNSFKVPEKLSKQQELRFMRKYGISPDDLNYLNSTDQNNSSPVDGDAAASMSVKNLTLNASPMNQSAGGAQVRPKSAGSSRPVHNTVGGGPAWGQPSERPRSASSERPRSAGSARPRSAGPTRSSGGGGGFAAISTGVSKSARNIQSAVNFSNTTGNLDDEYDDPFAALLHPITTTNSAAAQKENVADIFVNNHQPPPPTNDTAGDISEFSDNALLKELRERKQQKEGTFRSKSAQKTRRGEIDSHWKTPSSCFGGFNQGPHYKSTVAAKLKSAKKIAAMLERNKIRAKKRAPRSKKSGRHDVGRESEPIMYNEMKFRF